MKIAIVGAGPAGCAAALALHEAGAHVQVISDGGHGVGEHLPGACAPLLPALDYQPSQCVGIRFGEDWQWDGISHPLGGGWLLDRARFGHSLRRAVLGRGVPILEPSRLIQLEPGWKLHLDTGPLDCDFVIDASGRRGVVARRLGIQRHRYTRQRALVGQLHGPAQDEDAVLRVQPLDPDWAYTCRTGPGRRVAALVGEGELDWANLPFALPGYQLQAPPRIVPADATLLEEVSGPGWLAIGDAAASHDPIAGQGILAALQAGRNTPHLVDASSQILRDYQEQIRDRFHRLLFGRAQEGLTSKSVPWK